MPLTVEELRQEVLALPTNQRDELIASLTEVSSVWPAGLHAAWREELRSRSAEYKAGSMGSVPLEQFLEDFEDEPHTI